MGKLKFAWLFFLGLFIILYGFYRLVKLGFPYSQATQEYSNIFIIMFIGLAIAGMGSAYGKNKIKQQATQKEEAGTGAGEASEAEAMSKPPPKGTTVISKKPSRPSSKSTIFCQECGEENKTSAKFCDECGSKLIKTCPDCGGENDGSAKFCKECGIEL